MSELQNAFPPIETGDNVPAVCLAVAILGLVLGGLIVAARMHPLEAQMAINMGASTLSAPGSR
jgi:hypothetical protein